MLYATYKEIVTNIRLHGDNKQKKEEIKRSSEIGRQVNLEAKMMREAWDAYDWDSSTLDPTSQMPLSDPVRNKVCGHFKSSYGQKLLPRIASG